MSWRREGRFLLCLVSLTEPRSERIWVLGEYPECKSRIEFPLRPTDDDIELRFPKLWLDTHGRALTGPFDQILMTSQHLVLQEEQPDNGV